MVRLGPTVLVLATLLLAAAVVGRLPFAAAVGPVEAGAGATARSAPTTTSPPGPSPSRPEWPEVYQANVYWSGFFYSEPQKSVVYADYPKGLLRVDFYGTKDNDDPDGHVAYLFDYNTGIEYVMDVANDDCWTLPVPPTPPTPSPLPFHALNVTAGVVTDGKRAWQVDIFPEYDLTLTYTEKASRVDNYTVPVSISGGSVTLTFENVTIGTVDASMLAPASNCPTSLEDLGLTGTCVGSDHYQMSGVPDANLTSVFWPRHTGWTGGDGGQSTHMPDGTLVLNFDDGGFGYTYANSRVTAWGVHNMVGVVPNYANGTVPSYDAFEVFVKGNPSGGSGIQDFYTPPDWNAGSNYYWAGVGPAISEDEMIFVGTHLQSGGSTNVLFTVQGMHHALPSAWTYTASNISHSSVAEWGAPFVSGEWVYMVGGTPAFFSSGIHLSRTRFTAWADGDLAGTEYYKSNNKWGEWSSVDDLATLMDMDSDCTSLNYSPMLDAFYLTALKDNEVHVSISKKVTGPYSAHPVATIPEVFQDHFFVYCAVAHPAMARGENEIVISYFTNGADNSVLAKTIPNSYVSNYIRVTIAPGTAFCWYVWFLGALVIATIVLLSVAFLRIYCVSRRETLRKQRLLASGASEAEVLPKHHPPSRSHYDEVPESTGIQAFAGDRANGGYQRNQTR